MLKKIALLFPLVWLTACASLQGTSSDEVTQATKKLDASASDLKTLISEHCQHSDQLLGLLKESKQQVDELPKAEAQACEAESTSQGDKLVIGELENVYLISEKLEFAARVDSGAVSSALGAFNLTPFERDGKKWIRFTLQPDKESPTYEYPIEKRIRIAREKGAPVDRRPVILLKFAMGGKHYESHFSLADRSHLDYQVLLGREFLRDIAIVDVAHKYLMGSK